MGIHLRFSKHFLFRVFLVYLVYWRSLERQKTGYKIALFSLHLHLPHLKCVVIGFGVATLKIKKRFKNRIIKALQNRSTVFKCPRKLVQKFYIICWLLRAFFFFLVLSYDLLEDRRIGDVMIGNFLSLYYIKQIDSMLPCVCSVIDHRRRQNGIYCVFSIKRRGRLFKTRPRSRS